MDFNVRKLSKEDVEAYKALRLSALLKSATAFSDSYEDERAHPPEYFVSLLGDGVESFTLGCFTPETQLVGISTFKRDPRAKARHKSYIHTMYVDPRFRGRKIAKCLLAETVESAAELPGLEQIHLWVLNPATSEAKPLYLKAGFVPQGTIVRKDLKVEEEYIDAEYLVLHLESFRT